MQFFPWNHLPLTIFQSPTRSAAICLLSSILWSIKFLGESWSFEREDQRSTPSIFGRSDTLPPISKYKIYIRLAWYLNVILYSPSGFEVISYSSISKRPIFCDPYESFSFFRRSLECLDLEQIKFKFPILCRFKIPPPLKKI